MGYYERWWGTPTWGARPPMEVLDQYRMQEVIYGHAGFLGGTIWADVPLAWLEHHLLSPVTARYATALAVNIEYRSERALDWMARRRRNAELGTASASPTTTASP